MDAQRVDLLIQYALAVAAEEDHPRDRELRPIHLIKYCYIADLAYAREHDGQSYTGTPWQFYHYGPWSLDLYRRLEPAAKAIGAGEKRFSTVRQEDAVSWALPPGEVDPGDLGDRVPGSVAGAIKTSVHRFGSDTASLLHYVYTTEPMLNAAPGEALDLAPSTEADSPQPQVATDVTLRPRTLSKTAIKKLRAGVQSRLRALDEGRSARARPHAAPPYDEVFFQGQVWLDSLAGDEIVCDEGRVTFDESIWKSAGRREPKLP